MLWILLILRVEGIEIGVKVIVYFVCCFSLFKIFRYFCWLFCKLLIIFFIVVKVLLNFSGNIDVCWNIFLIMRLWVNIVCSNFFFVFCIFVICILVLVIVVIFWYEISLIFFFIFLGNVKYDLGRYRKV